MFKLDQLQGYMGGAEEEFGPPKPTVAQQITQGVRDITIPISMTSWALLGAGGLYLAYKIWGADSFIESNK